MINLYRKYCCEEVIDLNDIISRPLEFEVEYLDTSEDPFEIIRNFNIEDYYLNTLSIALYNPPLTLKLFPKSNLYGHELIRYYDL